MLLKPYLVNKGGIGLQDVFRLLVREHTDEYRNDALGQNGVAVGGKDHVAVLLLAVQPNLALAALNDVFFGLVLPVDQWKRIAQLGEDIVKVLKGIYDPEIPVDIYELGLIYDVMVNTDHEVKILMTLTSPNCPVAESLPQEVQEKINKIEGVKDTEVEITFDPPWSRDLMSEEAKLELGML